MFELAQELALPVFLFVPGFVEILRRYAGKFPRVRMAIDHCGMGYAEFPAGRSLNEIQCVTSPAYFQNVLDRANCPNVWLKWSHAQDRFAENQHPYEPLRKYLAIAIVAFGANRIMWASDKTVIAGHTWSELLYSLRDDLTLDTDNKAWLLGSSARAFLNWPSAAPSSS